MAARHVKRPVKLVLDRPQMFGPVGFRSHTHQTVGGGVKRDGTIVALRHDTVGQTSTFDEFNESQASLAARMLYASQANTTSHRLGAFRYRHALLHTCARMGYAGTNVLEIAIDRNGLRVKDGPRGIPVSRITPRTIPRNLCRGPVSRSESATNWPAIASAEPIASPSLVPCARAIRSSARAWRPPPTSSCRSEAKARARIDADGAILFESGTEDIGTGTYTVMTQVAADSLSVPTSRVTFRLGDTQDPRSASLGWFYREDHHQRRFRRQGEPGKALREKLATMAGARPDENRTDRRPHRGRAAPRRAIRAPARALCAHRGQDFIQVEAGAKPGSGRESSTSMYVFGAQFAEVRVRRPRSAKCAFPTHGGCVAPRARSSIRVPPRSQFPRRHGVGHRPSALYENAVMDARLGRFVNNNLAEYHIPVNADVPAMEALWVEETDTHVNPLAR